MSSAEWKPGSTVFSIDEQITFDLEGIKSDQGE